MTTLRRTDVVYGCSVLAGWTRDDPTWRSRPRRFRWAGCWRRRRTPDAGSTRKTGTDEGADMSDVRYDEPRIAAVGDVNLCFDAFGEPEHPTMLLVMGMGFQLVHWPERFCRQLAAE